MREIFVERREGLLRIAIKENNVLRECYIDEEKNEPIPGEIYKGIVKKIVPGIKSAFLDIGYDKQVYMFLDSNHKNIKCGDELIVEIIKEELGTKGAKVTPNFSIPGRYIVLESSNTNFTVSRKIENEDFKAELRGRVIKPEDVGVTVRTKGEFASVEQIQEELDSLYEEYKRVLREGKYSLKPKKLYGDEDFISKLIRDNISLDTKKIIVDSTKDYETIKSSMIDMDNIEVELYESGRTLFDYYGIEKEILSLRNNKVNLKCGGHIVIDKTEAMYVIDVNSGKNLTAKNMEKTAEETNIEAAREIARQIRLRNLSGIILVDFIDMHRDSNKKRVLQVLKEEFAEDKQKPWVYPFTELNLVQISRARRGKSIYDYIEESCEACHGHGKRLKLSYIYLLIKNEILKKDGEGKIQDFHIEINKLYEQIIRENIFEFLKEIDGLNLNIYLEFKEFPEYYKVEPLIFKNQIDSVHQYLVKNIEKY